jgi:hypothetical protein
VNEEADPLPASPSIPATENAVKKILFALALALFLPLAANAATATATEPARKATVPQVGENQHAGYYYYRYYRPRYYYYRYYRYRYYYYRSGLDAPAVQHKTFA